MNSLNLLVATIFALLILFSLVLAVILAKCWINRSKSKSKSIISAKQNSNEEIKHYQTKNS